MHKNSLTFLVLLMLSVSVYSRWSQQQANNWYSKFLWGAGVNYTPRYADNQIQFWSKLDLQVVNQELGWAKDLGFTKIRAFLHVAPYIQNATLFKKNIFQFLAVAKSKNIQVIPVLFDDCWRNTWHQGEQPEPIPGVHNSQWVQCPGDNPPSLQTLEKYVTDIIKTFRASDSIVFWDLYNEVGNSGKVTSSLPLVQKVFQWARKANPSQPLTSGWWNGDESFRPINDFILGQSDIITFHAYCDVECTLSSIRRFKALGRPVICTEYMARPMNSKFQSHLPVFREERVWAINWGFVFGRTQTYYPWWSKQGDPVPDVWFHDVLHPDGRPFDQVEADFIKNITRPITTA